MMGDNTINAVFEKNNIVLTNESTEKNLRFNGGFAVYTEYSGINYSTGNSSFAVDDIRDFNLIDQAGDIVDITTIYINDDMRNKGIGSDVINSICEYVGDKLIIASAGINKLEYSKDEFDNMTGDEKWEIIDKVSNFLKKNNFEDINAIIGGYENKATHVYLGNNSGKKFMEAYNKIESNL